MHCPTLAQKLIDAVKLCLGKNLDLDHRKEAIHVSFDLWTIGKDTSSMHWENMVCVYSKIYLFVNVLT